MYRCFYLATVSTINNYRFFACERADPAALLDAVLVLPSRSTCEAFVAAECDVTLEFPAWDSALPAADLDALPVEGLDKVLLALFAVVGLVDLLGIFTTSYGSSELTDDTFKY